jgi:hypothetical protein
MLIVIGKCKNKVNFFFVFFAKQGLRQAAKRLAYQVLIDLFDLLG